MFQVVKDHPRAFLYAVLVHLALIGMLVFSLDWTIKPEGGPAQSKPVQAIAIDESKLEAELERLQQAETQKEREAAERLRKIEEQARQAEAAREREQQRLQELKKKQEAEAQRLRDQEAQRKLEQQKAAEAKRQQEELARKKQAEEKRLAELEAKRKMEAEAKRKAAEKALQEQLAAERAAREAAQAEANQRVVNQYVGAIQAQVRRNWIQPTNWQGRSCTVQVQLIPGGDVASVQIVQSSGDPAFDRSVEAAVYRAAPLPLPPDPALFESFRTLRFVFAPK
ncbi:MAG: cell envelope integrity protein TolA [Pseudomonadota bacterium]